MYVILRDLFTQLFHVPTGEFTNWLLMCGLVIGLFCLIFK